MKVPSQTPVILAALSVAGALAGNVDTIAVDSAPDNASQLTSDQLDSLDSLTKGLNGAGVPTPGTGNPLAGLPAGVGTAGLPSAAGYSPETIAALVQQNQQLLGMLSAYLPSQAAAPASAPYGMVQGMLPGQLGQVMPQYGGLPSMYPGAVASQLQQFQQGSLPVAGLASGLPTGGLPTGGLPINSLPTGGLPINGLPINGLPAGGLPTAGLPINGLPTGSLLAGGLPTAPNLNGFPSLPMNLPLNVPQPWHLAGQPPAPVASAAAAAGTALSSATNLTASQPPVPLASAAASTAAGSALSSAQNLTASMLPAPVGSAAAAADPALSSVKNVTSDAVPTTPVDPSSVSNVTSKVNKLAQDVSFGQLAQNIPLAQGQSIVNGVVSNVPLPQGISGSQAAGALAGAAGVAGAASSQIGQVVPVSQIMNGPAGATYGQVSQLQPFQQASGAVKGVMNGQIGQGLPLDQATGTINGVSGGVLGGNGAVGLGQGLLGKILGPMSLQQKPDGKDRKHKPIPSVAAPSPLADASTLIPGGPSAALNVPQGALPNKLNLQQRPDGNDKHRKPVPSVAAPSPLADASALIPGGPSAALKVPQGVLPNKLKDDGATTDPVNSDSGDASGTGSDFGSAPGDSTTVDTSSADSTPAPRPKKAKSQRTGASRPTATASNATDDDGAAFATDVPAAPTKAAKKKPTASQPTTSTDDATVPDDSSAPSVSDDDVTDDGSGSQPAATQPSRPKSNKPTRTPSSHHAAGASSPADADQTDDQASLRPQNRAWTWIAPRSEGVAGRFIARDLRRDAAADLLSAKGSLNVPAPPANPLINGPAPAASGTPTKSSKSGSGKARMEYKKTKSASKSKEQTDYDNAREALIKAEASMWEAEHPQGMDRPKYVDDESDGATVALNDLDEQASDDDDDNTGKKGVTKKPKASNPLWAWIGGNSVTATVQAGGDNTKSEPTGKGKKGKKNGTSSSTSSAPTLAAASFKFPASMTGLLKAGAPESTPGPASSAPIRPPVKVGIYNV